MSEWYYADAARERQGPVTAAELERLRLSGALGWDSLVWRDGMAGWQPMRDFAFELATNDAPALPPASKPPADPASPYAPPAAPVATDAAVVQGGEVVLAGFWKRFAALVIDGFVTAAVSWAVQIPLFLVAGMVAAGGNNLFSGGGSLALVLVSYGIGLVIPLFYFAWMQSSATQASLGKMAIGIKVTRGDGSRIGFWRAFARYCAYFLTVALSLGLGGVVSALTTGLGARKQALHDMLCDTLVVDKWAFTDRPDLQRRELGVVAWVVIVIGGGLAGLAILGITAALAIPAMGR